MNQSKTTISCFQVEKKEDGIAGEREENPVMEAVRRIILIVGCRREIQQLQRGDERDIVYSGSEEKTNIFWKIYMEE